MFLKHLLPWNPTVDIKYFAESWSKHSFLIRVFIIIRHKMFGLTHLIFQERILFQWLRLALSKGPNWLFVFPPNTPEDGNRSSFRNVVFYSSYNTGRWKKSKNPVILKWYTIVRTLQILLLLYLLTKYSGWISLLSTRALKSDVSCYPCLYNTLHTHRDVKGSCFFTATLKICKKKTFFIPHQEEDLCIFRARICSDINQFLTLFCC
jgi:hypothetical protein